MDSLVETGVATCLETLTTGSHIEATGTHHDFPLCSSEKTPADLHTESHTATGLVLEVFAGSCRFSKACKDSGLRAFAVDKNPKRAEHFPVANFDLTRQHDFETLCKYAEAESGSLVHAHFAPSCGTASKAREKKIPGVSNAPRPLRSESYPDGLPSLHQHEQDRVREANISYEAMVRFLLFLVALGVSVSIENPVNSLFWNTSFMLALFAQIAGHFSILQHCMHGGTRDKKSKFWSFNPRCPNVNLLETLAILCDGSHVHASWKPRVVDNRLVFPTAEEAAYPILLCQRFAALCLQEAIDRGVGPVHSLSQQLQISDTVGKRQIYTVQSRANKLKQTVSEFGETIQVAVSLRPNAAETCLKAYPKGSRILQRHLAWGYNRDEWKCGPNVEIIDGERYEILKIGLPRTPQKFIHEAVQAGHPKHSLARVSSQMQFVLDKVFAGDLVEVQQARAAFFKKWLKRAVELKTEEEQLHCGLPTHLQSILHGKKLLLWSEILNDLGYPDAKVIEEACQGFPLTGWASQSDVFEVLVRPPQHSVQQLSGMAKGLNMAVVSSLKKTEWSDLDEAAWHETCAESDKGWLSKECEADLSRNFVAKRFPIRQGEKLRLIDDFSVCGVNGAFAMTEKLRVDSIDEIMASLTTLMNKGTKHQVLGRTFDLKSAYKQFGTDPEHVEKLRIAIKKPGGGVAFFKALALPFGATGSVAAFLRLSAAIAFIGLKGLWLPWSSFFDDFTVIAPEGLEDNTTFYAEGLFKLLGVDFASEGKKAPPFSRVFRTLGLVVDVSQLHCGLITLGHTEERRAELLESLRKVVTDGKNGGQISTKSLEQLHGRLVWFNSFVFGRKLNFSIRVVSAASRQRTSKVVVSASLLDAVTCMIDHLQSSRNVKVQRDLNISWLIFTDGAYEPTAEKPATIGGVLINPNGQVVSYFGAALPETLLAEFLEESRQPIYELEIFPLVVAVRLWAEFLVDVLLVHYLDNDAARSACIRGDAATPLGRALIQNYISHEYKCRFSPWFSRVPTSSNPADDPSRLVFNVPWLQGAKCIPLVLPSHLSDWGIHRVR